MSHAERGIRAALIGCLLAAAASATGCATGASGRIGGAPSAPHVQFSGGPELVGTASLPYDSTAPAPLAAALVLQQVSWPITGVDSARGALDSDWQYFEPAIRGSARQGHCENPMALRFTIRTLEDRWVRIAAEAYLPHPGASAGWSAGVVPDDESGRGQALAQARSALASLRKAVAAAGGEEDAAIRAWRQFGHELDSGSYRRCAVMPT